MLSQDTLSLVALGSEEPIRVPNRMLLEFCDRSERGVQGTFSSERMARYSFVWLGENALAAHALASIARSILSATGLQAWWLMGWPTSGFEGAAYKARVIEARRRKEGGWNIAAVEGHMAAMRAVTVGEPHSLSSTRSFSWAGTGVCILAGAGLTLPGVLTTQTRGTLRRFCSYKDMIPSAPFLEWLGTAPRVLIYLDRDDMGRLGLIVVASEPLNWPPLRSQWGMKESSPLAERVWRIPPW